VIKKQEQFEYGPTHKPSLCSILCYTWVKICSKFAREWSILQALAQ